MFVQIHQEAEEDGVHCHVIDREEGGGDGVGPEDDDDHGDKVVVEMNVQSGCDLQKIFNIVQNYLA